MYGTLTNPKRLRRLPHRCLILNDIICNLYCPFLDIILHLFTPALIVFTMYAEVYFHILKLSTLTA